MGLQLKTHAEQCCLLVLVSPESIFLERCQCLKSVLSQDPELTSHSGLLEAGLTVRL